MKQIKKSETQYKNKLLEKFSSDIHWILPRAVYDIYLFIRTREIQSRSDRITSWVETKLNSFETKRTYSPVYPNSKQHLNEFPVRQRKYEKFHLIVVLQSEKSLLVLRFDLWEEFPAQFNLIIPSLEWLNCVYFLLLLIC